MLAYRNQIEIQEKIQLNMKKYDIDSLILLAPESIFYATGFASQFLYLSNKIGLTAAVINRTGEVKLIVNEFEKQAALSSCKDVEIISYPVWIYIDDYADSDEEKEEQPDLNRVYKMAIDIIKDSYSEPKVAIEFDKVSFDKYEVLCEKIGKNNLFDCFDILVDSRSIKTKWEIDTLRKAAQISEIAMHKTAKNIVPGMTEADVMAEFKINCQNQSSDVMNVLQAHTIGKDFAPAIVPRYNRIGYGDIVRLDGGPIIYGYGSDLARTFAVGGKTDPYREELYSKLYKAYIIGLSMIKPGVKMSHVFTEMENKIKEYLPKYKRGHYGHSIGCNIFTEEYPFISLGSGEKVFEENMVFCIEVPYYSSKNHSYNIEDTFAVTSDGIDLFTKANESLYIL